MKIDSNRQRPRIISTLILIILSLSCHSLFASKIPEVDLSSPRSSFKTFLKSMVLVKQNTESNKAYINALQTMDLEYLDPTVRVITGQQLANKLVDILDRTEKINYEKISLKPQTNFWIYSSQTSQVNFQVIFTKNKSNEWKIDRQTLRQVPKFYEKTHSQSLVSGVIELKTYTQKIKSLMPKWSSQRFLFLKLGQWLFIISLGFLAFLVKIISGYMLRFFIKKQFSKIPKKTLELVTAPIGLMLSLFVIVSLLYLAEFSASTLAFWTKSFYISLSILFIWLGLGLVKLASFFLNKVVMKTKTKVDNILIPLLAKVANGLVIIIGIILIANSLNIDVNSLLAGLGIGAMAFAFAAKDTLANFFGSIMIVLDRPFDLGDYISVDGMTGTVEEVGFRSTRLRSAQDSIISIPNGQLANESIDNFGRRRFRRSDIILGIEYDTPPEKIDLFCEGLRKIISQKEWIKSDDSLIYFDSFGDSALHIKIKFFIMTQGFSTAALYKHDILLEFLALGNDMGIGFAFPTQTLYLKK